MAGIVEKQSPQIDFEIFDGTTLSRENVLHDDDLDLHAVDRNYRSTFAHTSALSVGGRTWTLHFTTRPAFDAASDFSQSWLICFGGLCISLLVAGITQSLLTTRQRALNMAEEMTEKVRRSTAPLNPLTTAS